MLVHSGEVFPSLVHVYPNRVWLRGHAGEVLVGEVFLGQFHTQRCCRFFCALPCNDAGDGVVRAERCDQLGFELKASPFCHFQGACFARTACARA